MRLPLVCFYCLCVLFMFSILSRRCPLLATSLSVLFCLLSMLISDSRFDLVWFRLSCDHGWIRNGSVNVRKQQQQPCAMCKPVSLRSMWCASVLMCSKYRYFFVGIVFFGLVISSAIFYPTGRDTSLVFLFGFEWKYDIFGILCYF